MPDAAGFPTERECIALIDLTAPDPATARLLKEIAPVRARVLADFQAPTGTYNTGGTGRSFTPLTETRVFDGNGKCELPVHDIVPPGLAGDGLTVTNPIAVCIFAYVLTDVSVRQARPGDQHNVLFRQQYYGPGVPIAGDVGVIDIPGVGAMVPFPQRVFPAGLQNVSVTATWGAVVSADIYDAIRGEVCYQALVRGVVGLNGVGEDISIGDFELNTSVGAINFKLTSPLTVLHQAYLDAKATYRLRPLKRQVRFVQNMI